MSWVDLPSQFRSGDSVQIIELLILAVLAGVVLYQLYAVLGRRVGRQPEDGLAAQALGGADDTAARRAAAPTSPPVAGLDTLHARDPNFDADHFLKGARTAYETIVMAYAAGDREKLRPLVSEHVLGTWIQALDARDAEGRSERVEFLHPPRADIEAFDAESDTARARVRFLSEIRARSKGPEGEAVDDHRTAEVWTFERPITSRDPNWILTRVEEADA